MAAITTAAQRARGAIRSAWPQGAPGYALLALIGLGLALRLIAMASWWPVSTTLGDSYELYATKPFENPLHPAGYPLIMGGIGLVTRQVAAIIVLQHLSAIASALLLWAGTRRITGSAWAGLLPAGVVLLDPDFIFLEHTIMSESWFVLAISAGLYAVTRAVDEPKPYWRWPLVAGAALAAAVTIRTAALPLILVAAVAVLICQPRSSGTRPTYVRSALTILSVSAVLLLGFATANATFGRGFGFGASPGWYLYARAAQFADCERFSPPAGTEALCQTSPSADRPGSRYYLFDRTAPARRLFGEFGSEDDRVGTWAKRAILAQPGDYLANVWENLRSYWVPGLRHRDSTLTTDPFHFDQGLDPQLAFNNGLDDSDLYELRPGVAGSSQADLVRFLQAIGEHNLETFYDDFTVHKGRAGLDFLRAWQRVVRFGATALFIATLLVLAGLVFGTRRSRVGVLLFGIGGISLLLVPAFTANTWDRYTVPMAGPMLAAVAITIAAMVARRRTGRTT
jgi:dolichyl-phosphate-mannose-protein mannosyltransferase